VRTAVEGTQPTSRAAALRVLPAATFSSTRQRTRSSASRVLRSSRRSHNRVGRLIRSVIVRPPCPLVSFRDCIQGIQGRSHVFNGLCLLIPNQAKAFRGLAERLVRLPSRARSTLCRSN